MFRNITAKQVHDFLGKLKNGKANGIDMIPNKVLKLAAPHISISLAAIFNKRSLHRIFPDDLKTGKVVSIFKGDERHECGNNRPITFAINSLIILTLTIFYVMNNGIYTEAFHYTCFTEKYKQLAIKYG